MSRKIFITATDTGAGKTYLTSRLVGSLLKQKQRALAIKPVACGSSAEQPNEDVAELLRAQNLSDPGLINLYDFSMPAAPSLAAAEEGREIDPATLTHWCHSRSSESDICLIEGVGGLMVPLNDHYLVSDWLAEMTDCEVMLVIGARLGCINHALLTLKQLSDMNRSPNHIVINATDQSSASDQALHALKPFLSKSTSLHISPYQGDNQNIDRIAKAILAKNRN
ncbi:dethiobiotin synthase [Pseudomonadota bacterium]